MWRIRKSNGENANQSKPQKHGPKMDPDKIWAMLRRINARLSENESAVSILKRDVWRIEKKSSQEKIKSSTETSEVPDFDRIINEMLKGA